MMWPGYRTVWTRCAFLHAMTAQHDLIIMIYASATHVLTRCGSYDHNLFMKRLDHVDVLYPHLTFFSYSSFTTLTVAQIELFRNKPLVMYKWVLLYERMTVAIYLLIQIMCI